MPIEITLDVTNYFMTGDIVIALISLNFNIWHSMISISINRILFFAIRIIIYKETVLKHSVIGLCSFIELTLLLIIIHVLLRYSGYLLVEKDIL